MTEEKKPDGEKPQKNDLQAKVAAWVESSGRALELRVARAFRGGGETIFVNQSIAYTDPVTSQPREGDVRACYRWMDNPHVVAIEAAVECKAGRDKPWVAFFDNELRLDRDLFSWAVLSDDWTAEAMNTVMGHLEWADWLNNPQIATHAASALGNDSHNTVYDAARQALSFAKALAASPTRVAGDPATFTRISAALPIVVTQAPLFTCRLSQENEVDLQQVDGFDVLLQVDRLTRHRVYVRSEQALAYDIRKLAYLRERRPH